MRPFYDLIANIAAEEYGHIELVAYTINLLLTGTTTRGSDPSDDAAGRRDGRPQQLPLHRHRPAGRAAATRWATSGPAQNVFSSGNLKLDLLHNFFLECGARANKIRVYEMAKEPDRPRDDRLPARPRRRAHRRLRQGAGEADAASPSASCCRSRTSATSSSPKRASTRRRACTASSTASAPTTTSGRSDLERPAPRGRQELRSWTARPKAARSAGPRRRAAAHGPGGGHGPGHVQEIAKRLFG